MLTQDIWQTLGDCMTLFNKEKKNTPPGELKKDKRGTENPLRTEQTQKTVQT